MINRISQPDAASARQSFESTAAEIRSKLKLPQVNNFAIQHPAAVLAMGAIVGVLVGCWVKRR